MVCDQPRESATDRQLRKRCRLDRRHFPPNVAASREARVETQVYIRLPRARVRALVGVEAEAARALQLWLLCCFQPGL